MAVQVFRLDAVEGSDAKAAWQQLQNHAASLSSFRGRALMGPIAMPPTSRVLPPLQAYQVCSACTFPAKCSEPKALTLQQCLPGLRFTFLP